MKSFSRRKALKTIGLAVGAVALAQTPLPLHSTPIFSAFTDKKFPSTGVLIGAGIRGKLLGDFLQTMPGRRLKLVGVADQQRSLRNAVTDQHSIAQDRHFEDWKQMLQQPRFADVVIITAYGDYAAPCTAALKAGYDVWMDKPVSVDITIEKPVLELAKNLGRQVNYFYIHDGELHTKSLLDKLDVANF